jgi:hypothetical protein
MEQPSGAPVTDAEMDAAEEAEKTIVEEVILEPTPIVPGVLEPEVKEVFLTLSDKEYRIKRCSPMAGVTAIGILFRYARPAIPVLRQIGEPNTDYLKLLADFMEVMGPNLEEKPEDLFKIVSLLSGISVEDLANNIDFVEFGDVIGAIFKVTNMRGLLSLASNFGR